MPTKRRPLKHGPHVGEVRITDRLLDLYRSYQDEVRAHGSYARRAAELNSAIRMALGHMPWGDQEEHDLHYHQLHELAYPDPQTRPKRLAKIVSWHNPLIADYEREHRAEAAGRRQGG